MRRAVGVAARVGKLCAQMDHFFQVIKDKVRWWAWAAGTRVQW